jgi:ribonucleoside-diphosphate reductase alpha chain
MKWLENQKGTDAALPKPTLNKEIKGHYPEKNKNIDLSDNSRTILEKRYLRKNEDGSFAETIPGLFDRVANAIAKSDEGYRDVKLTSTEFYNMLTTKKFFPNSPTFTGAGTPLGQLSGCFVLPISDDMGREKDGIFSTLRVGALIQQTGGGNGFSFSDLRSGGGFVSRSGGKASGPVGFLKVYDSAYGVIAQGGVRRGANMAVLRVDHPDIREFIKCKSSEGEITNFNISVAATDVFMKAVEADTTYELIDPHTKKVTETPKAQEIFDLMVEYAYKNGEPGILFIDTANRANPIPHMYELKATNPCGEQWLGPYENCCLGSINLAMHLNDNGQLDWGAYRDTIRRATRFLDNVIDQNSYVSDVPEVKEAAMNVRRIGLGFMGLADAMYSMGIRYGSEEGQEFAAQIAEFMRYHSMKTSIELAEEKGAFPKIEGSIYDPKDLKWTPPKSSNSYKKNFGRPLLNWSEITSGIKKFGIRNAAQTTVAPTGTISTVAGVEGYGCEPVFALAYYRNVYQAAMDEKGLTLAYTSPLFAEALDKAGITGDDRKAIVDEVIETGTCQDIKTLPDELKDTFVVSSDITPQEHIKMQVAIQDFVDNSISKTCNFPFSANKEDVKEVYKMGWELGCKGLTVYVTGSREEVVLETKATKAKKGDSDVSVTVGIPTQRPRKLAGVTYKLRTPQGNAYVTINKDEMGNPLEIFMSVGKAGSDVAGLSEALGRALSGWLQASINPKATVKEMAFQLKGIGGAKSVGFGQKKINSIPDAIAQVLAEEFELEVNGNGVSLQEVSEVQEEAVPAGFVSADMCPDCGNASIVKQEGCEKCYNCGYSVC